MGVDDLKAPPSAFMMGPTLRTTLSQFDQLKRNHDEAGEI